MCDLSFSYLRHSNHHLRVSKPKDTFLFFTYKPNEHESILSPSLSPLSPILQVWQWKVSKSRWKSARGFELFGCFDWHAIFRGRNSFFSAENHIYSPVKVAAVKMSSNSPGLVGRECKRFYWKRVQSNRISIVWLLYLKETPCSIKHQREITF